jgi:GNAT superfamily N-acetyltransferase
MKKITSGWETDLAILSHGGSSIEEFEDHIVVRSPQNPDYHWGNFILVSNVSHVDDGERWLNTFTDAFPEATWTAIGLPQFPDSLDAWTDLGLELERMEVLKAHQPPSIPDISSNYTSRIFGDGDWDLLLARELSENKKSGEHDPESFKRYISNAIKGYEELSRKGLAAWFGAFHGSELVADLGIVVCGEMARYQSVQTDESHRRNGLATHLLGIAADWAQEKGCTSWVIVTESTNGAGRVYRRAGFKPDLETVTAYRASW